MPEIPNTKNNHDPNEFKIGDFVEVTGWTDHWTEYVGKIKTIDSEYCYLENISSPFDSKGLGFRSKMLTATLPDDELAIATLGEDYFA